MNFSRYPANAITQVGQMTHLKCACHGFVNFSSHLPNTQRRSLLKAALTVPAVSAAPAWAIGKDPDTIFINGKISTLDPAHSTVTAIAVKQGKITHMGDDATIRTLAGSTTRIVDFKGRRVIPGLIDAHCHPMETIYMQRDWVDARYPGVPTVNAALERIQAWANKTEPNKWIFVACVSASQNKFQEKRLPNRTELDRVAPNNPVVLANGTHMAVANSMALKMLGVTKGVNKLKHGGSALLDAQGEPTGVLTDVQADVPTTPTLEEMRDYYSSGIQTLWNQFGFTSVLAITPSAALPVMQHVAQHAGQPTLRYTVSVWTSSNAHDMPEDLGAFEMPAVANPDFYRFGGIKDWVDGENDCRTGYMYESYIGHAETDPPGNKGTLVTPQNDIDRVVRIAAKQKKFSMLHCSGDRAMDMGLTAIEKLIQSTKGNTLARIEHFGMFQMQDSQLARAKKLKSRGLHISIQPTWLLELVKADFENMPAAVAKTGFQFRKMIDAGLEPAAGTDMTGIYMGNINPFTAMYASVMRNSDRGVFQPEQAVTVTEALSMWTIWAARSLGESKLKGSLEIGKYADMAVLSDDIFAISPDKIKDLKVATTIVNGEVVYSS